jgi:hypothetical protein
MTIELARAPGNHQMKPWRRAISTAVVGLAGLSVGFTVAAAAPAAASPAPVDATYQLVLGALESGKPVRVVIDQSRCVTRTGQAGPAVQAGVEISSFVVKSGKGLIFHRMYSSVDATNQPVTEYTEYNLTSDGELTVAVEHRRLDKVTRRPPLICKVPVGAKFIW